MTLERVEQTAMPTEVSPAEFKQAVETARAKAVILTDIIEDAKDKNGKHLYKSRIGSAWHIHVEAWQTLATAYGLTASTLTSENHTTVEYLKDEDGNILGATASAIVINKYGMVVGGASSICTLAEANKEKMTPSQLAGLAQTRAISRALRQILSWVVVLAGYDPTPADEMFSVDGSPTPIAVQIQERSDSPKKKADDGTPLTDPQSDLIKKILAGDRPTMVEGNEKWTNEQAKALMSNMFPDVSALANLTKTQASDFITELKKGPVQATRDFLNSVDLTEGDDEV